MPTHDDDEDGETTSGATTYFQTKNEVVDVPITIPDLEEIGMDEVLEKVGEVLSVIGDIAIVKGLPSDFANRGSERALDSETLLVFGDRKVMGYVRFSVPRSILVVDALLARYTKLLGLLLSHCTKSNSTSNTRLTQKKSRLGAMYSTYRDGAISSLFTCLNGPKVVMPVMCTMKNLERMK